MTARCRNCAHYDREAHRNKAGKVAMRKDRMARCLFNMDRLARKFPASLPERDRPTRLSWMLPNNGARCPQWTRIEETEHDNR